MSPLINHRQSHDVPACTFSWRSDSKMQLFQRKSSSSRRAKAQRKATKAAKGSHTASEAEAPCPDTLDITPSASRSGTAKSTGDERTYSTLIQAAGISDAPPTFTMLTGAPRYTFPSPPPIPEKPLRVATNLRDPYSSKTPDVRSSCLAESAAVAPASRADRPLTHYAASTIVCALGQPSVIQQVHFVLLSGDREGEHLRRRTARQPRATADPRDCVQQAGTPVTPISAGASFAHSRAHSRAGSNAMKAPPPPLLVSPASPTVFSSSSN